MWRRRARWTAEGGPAITFAVALLGLALVSHAARAQTPKAFGVSSNAPSATPAKPEAPKAFGTETGISQSVFIVPTSPREGRDPFFPNSTSPYGTTTTNIRTNQKPAVTVTLVLQGISGTRERPLAIINNQTFAAGEENDVISGTQRIRIRCLEINAVTETVIVQLGNERRELRLRQPK